MRIDVSTETPMIVACKAPESNTITRFVFVPSKCQEDPLWFIGLAMDGGKFGISYQAAFKMDESIGGRQVVDCSTLYVTCESYYMQYRTAMEQIDRLRKFMATQMIEYAVISVG